MSETGGIVRRLRFRKSDPETTAVRLNVSDGLLSIVLANTGKDQVQIRKYLVMYAVTGEKFGYYEPSEELGNTDVCFSRAVTGEKFGYYEPSEELGNTDVCFSRTDGYTFDPSSPDPESLLKIKAM